MIEMAIGRYPYPPETYANVFAQLTAIVHGDPPELPDTYSEDCRDFVNRCLHKVPEMRATYAELLVGVMRATLRGVRTNVSCRTTSSCDKIEIARLTCRNGLLAR